MEGLFLSFLFFSLSSFSFFSSPFLQVRFLTYTKEQARLGRKRQSLGFIYEDETKTRPLLLPSAASGRHFDSQSNTRTGWP
jgi:hypothetical protein